MIIGKYIERENRNNNVRLLLDKDDLEDVWLRCGLTANYGADYIALNRKMIGGLRNTLSMILNELIENAAKYGVEFENAIEVKIFIINDHLVCQVDNVVNQKQLKIFKDFAEHIINSPEEEYMKRLAIVPADDKISQLGLLTLRSFFKVTLGFKFMPPDNSGNSAVSVQTEMILDDMKEVSA